MDHDTTGRSVAGEHADIVPKQDPQTRSDLDFLARWEQMSPRDTGAMLRASLLRRTSPHLADRTAAPENQCDRPLAEPVQA
ncbi:hypothetical protein GOB93_06010 [Acetobacter musti]|uniref:Uncharacterized protein n=1 Tax=Acetobacter musti TaxID=864732 RepID=A0ABX0JQ15_9PROT|nr:hypothetical protein [Acetobacter musti]NHN84198.1 hypothetical protein [Acetobacter musti]